ncbi:urea transporter [Burkholderia sp. YIM B11467]
MPTARPASPSIDLRILLRGIGQIVLQANALTGALLLAALALTDLRLASAALLGSAAASMTAVLTGAERRDVEQGLHGFNGALAALIAVLFAPDSLAAVALVPLAAIGAALVQRAMRVPLARWRQCPYSSPCLAVTALWLPFVALQHANGAAADAALTLSSVADALLSGVAQTTFAQGAWAGALIVAGIAAASRRAAAFALGGAIVSTVLLVALGGAIVSTVLLVALGASGASYADGLLGFNGALAALALMPRGPRAALAAAALAALIQWLATRAGMPAFTAPFALASWVTVAVARRFTLGETDVVIRTPS